MSAIKNISLFIPHVFPNFDKEYIANAFKNIGEVSQIDLVAKQDRNGNNYNTVYVHFKKWYTNKKALAFYDSVVDESKEARLCHDEPWYWIVLPNTAKKHIPGDRKPRIDLSDMKSTAPERTYDGYSVLTADKTFEDELDILEGDIQNSWNDFKKKEDTFKRNGKMETHNSTTKICPGAPKKPSYADKVVNMIKMGNTKHALSEYDNHKNDYKKTLLAERINLKSTFDEAIAFEAELENDVNKQELAASFPIDIKDKIKKEVKEIEDAIEEAIAFKSRIEAEIKELDSEFDEAAAFEAQIEAEMDEIEDFLEAEDENLVRIDGRYVQQLEQENWAMSGEIAELRAALIKMDQMYQAEAAKVRASEWRPVDFLGYDIEE